MLELTDEKLADLQAAHPAGRLVEFLTDDEKTVSVFLRPPRADRYDPKTDEFFKYWTKRAAIASSVEDLFRVH